MCYLALGNLYYVTRGDEMLLVAGWREVSLVDVLDAPSFTVWLCGCNLRCPWCSNARIARGEGCKYVRVADLADRAVEASKYVEYLHCTGGEPLLQARGLKELFELGVEAGLLASLDTNGMLPRELEEIEDLVHHVSVDVKAPPSRPGLYAAVVGAPLEAGSELVGLLVRSIEIATQFEFCELRTTMVPGLIGPREVEEIASFLSEFLGLRRGERRVAYVVQQFIPYEGVEGRFRGEPRTPPDLVEEAARRAAKKLSIEVYARTLEHGLRKYG